MKAFFKFMLLMILLARPLVGFGQANGAFNNNRRVVGGGGKSAFNQTRESRFNDYRGKLNAEYEHITREHWGSFNAHRGMSRPDKDVKPVAPVPYNGDDGSRGDGCTIERDAVYAPIRQGGTPQPVAPIKEQHGVAEESHSFAYYGTAMSVRVPIGAPLRLAGVDENSVADGWNTLSQAGYNNTVVDCMRLRSRHKICDWGYLMLLKTLSESMYGNSNEAVLLMAFIYSQSGYKMRLAQGGGRLEMLYASRHNIYETAYFECDGDKFYTMNRTASSLCINSAKFPKEQSLSLWITGSPELAVAGTGSRTLTSERYPDVSVRVSANANLMDFFSTYPTSEVGGNFMTRWAMYANTPLCAFTRDELYPQLQRSIAGLSQIDAAERLLNWVQTAFVYEYDDKVWGGDRAFFAEETLKYPYCDCEDRSILFTRLVRDLLGLKCVLVYYPGHLAAAVGFTDDVQGDYIVVSGRKYVITDPTYIGAAVGRTMPDMDNSAAKVILLD